MLKLGMITSICLDLINCIDDLAESAQTFTTHPYRPLPLHGNLHPSLYLLAWPRGTAADDLRACVQNW